MTGEWEWEWSRPCFGRIHCATGTTDATVDRTVDQPVTLCPTPGTPQDAPVGVQTVCRTLDVWERCIMYLRVRRSCGVEVAGDHHWRGALEPVDESEHRSHLEPVETTSPSWAPSVRVTFPCGRAP